MGLTQLKNLWVIVMKQGSVAERVVSQRRSLLCHRQTECGEEEEEKEKEEAGGGVSSSYTCNAKSSAPH